MSRVGIRSSGKPARLTLTPPAEGKQVPKLCFPQVPRADYCGNPFPLISLLGVTIREVGFVRVTEISLPSTLSSETLSMGFYPFLGVEAAPFSRRYLLRR